MTKWARTKNKTTMVDDDRPRIPRREQGLKSYCYILVKPACPYVTQQKLSPDLKDPKPTTKCDDNKTADPWAEVLPYSNGEATDQLLARKHKKLRSGPTLLRKSELCGLVKMATDI